MNTRANVLLLVCLLVLAPLAKAGSTVCPAKNPDDANEVYNYIAKILNCAEAASVAESCAFGSSVDEDLAGKAASICLSTVTLSAGDKALMTDLSARCDKKYSEMSGSIYISLDAFCRLGVVKLLSNLNSSPEDEG